MANLPIACRRGRREYIQVLRLLEDSPENQVAAVEDAVKRRLIGFDAVSELARKLYRHSHDKIAAIGPEAADFLRRRFE